MKSITVTALVRSLASDDLVSVYRHLPSPARIDIAVSGHRQPLDGFGIKFHDAFHAVNQQEWIERSVYSFVRTVRHQLNAMGVAKIFTEWRHWGKLNGTADASLVGGPKRWGTLENKVVADAPTDGYVEDIAQLAAYCHLAASSNRPMAQQWAGLCYVLPTQRAIRFLYWTNVRPLVVGLDRALALSRRRTHTETANLCTDLLSPRVACP